MSLTIPGSTALFGSISPILIPGSDVLAQPVGGSAPASTTAATGVPANQNPYLQAFDQITIWSNSYLMQSVENGPGLLPDYAGGSSAAAFASLSNTLAAIKPGLQAGLYGGGTGVNTLA